MGLLYSHYEANQKINAVSGTLTKTFKDSYFVRLKKGSQMEREYFNDNHRYRRSGYREKTDIVVLQVMLISEENYIVEAIDKEDYEKMFKSESGEKNG